MFEPVQTDRLILRGFREGDAAAVAALDLVAEECRTLGATSLLTSWGEGKGSPRSFYLAHGFVPTGRIVDDETEARWTF